MADYCEPLDEANDEANDSEPLLPVTPFLRLDAPLVAHIDVVPSGHIGVPSEHTAQFTMASASSIDADVDRHLHGAPELLAPAELRRAALLRLIGLGRFASRP